MLYAIQICSSLVKLRDNEQFESVPRWELVFTLSQIRTIRAWKHYPTTYLIAESLESHIARYLIDLSYVKILCNFCTYVLKAQRELFPDAEVCKYIPKYLVVGDFADDFAEIVDGSAQVFAHEVTAEAEFEALLYFLDVCKGTG